MKDINRPSSLTNRDLFLKARPTNFHQRQAREFVKENNHRTGSEQSGKELCANKLDQASMLQMKKRRLEKVM